MERYSFDDLSGLEPRDTNGAWARHEIPHREPPSTATAAAESSSSRRRGALPRPRLVGTPPAALALVGTAGAAGLTDRDRAGFTDPGERALDEMVARVAPSRVSVLITGETGVGKDILARRIHRASPRTNRPFVTVNCAAFCESLLESELFGHLRGAFTGAEQSRAGLIEAADGGTIFLDELGELSPAAQAKLLRVIETRLVTRVGSTTPTLVDVRFLAATHRDLEAAIGAGRFRADLLYRLEGIRLTLPPLRERRHEIVPAAEQFLDELSARDRIPRAALSPAAAAALLHHPWPGNFRELRNVMERAALICEGGCIRPDDLLIATMGSGGDASARSGSGPGAFASPGPTRAPWEGARDARRESDRAPILRPGAAETAPDAQAIPESMRISSALDSCAGNQTRAAKLLGMSRRTFITRLEKHGIARPRLRGFAARATG